MENVNASKQLHYSTHYRKNLNDKIADLGRNEHEEIFNILLSHDQDYTRNKNGVFVNFSDVPDDVIAKIDAFVAFCIDNKQRLDEYDKKIQECKMSGSALFSSTAAAAAVCTMSTMSTLPTLPKYSDIVCQPQLSHEPVEASTGLAEVADGTRFPAPEEDRVVGLPEDLHAAVAAQLCADTEGANCKKKVTSKYNAALKKYSKKKNTDGYTASSKVQLVSSSSS